MKFMVSAKGYSSATSTRLTTQLGQLFSTKFIPHYALVLGPNKQLFTIARWLITSSLTGFLYV